VLNNPKTRDFDGAAPCPPFHDLTPEHFGECSFISPQDPDGVAHDGGPTTGLTLASQSAQPRTCATQPPAVVFKEDPWRHGSVLDVAWEMF